MDAAGRCRQNVSACFAFVSCLRLILLLLIVCQVNFQHCSAARTSFYRLENGLVSKNSTQYAGSLLLLYITNRHNNKFQSSRSSCCSGTMVFLLLLFFTIIIVVLPPRIYSNLSGNEGSIRFLSVHVFLDFTGLLIE